jgi:hypothetical protein
MTGTKDSRDARSNSFCFLSERRAWLQGCQRLRGPLPGHSVLQHSPAHPCGGGAAAGGNDALPRHACARAEAQRGDDGGAHGHCACCRSARDCAWHVGGPAEPRATPLSRLCQRAASGAAADGALHVWDAAPAPCVRASCTGIMHVVRARRGGWRRRTASSWRWRTEPSIPRPPARTPQRRCCALTFAAATRRARVGCTGALCIFRCGLPSALVCSKQRWRQSLRASAGAMCLRCSRRASRLALRTPASL